MQPFGPPSEIPTSETKHAHETQGASNMVDAELSYPRFRGFDQELQVKAWREHNGSVVSRHGPRRTSPRVRKVQIRKHRPGLSNFGLQQEHKLGNTGTQWQTWDFLSLWCGEWRKPCAKEFYRRALSYLSSRSNLNAAHVPPTKRTPPKTVDRATFIRSNMALDLPAELWTQIFDLAADEDILFIHALPTSFGESVWWRDHTGRWRLRSPQQAMNLLQARSYATKKVFRSLIHYLP